MAFTSTDKEISKIDLGLIDIVIVNYKSSALLLDCLNAIFETTQGTNQPSIFVQDNGSDDGIDDVIIQFPKVNFTRNTCNLGFSRAVNQALKWSDAPYVLLLNPDTIVSDGFFERILEYMEDHQDVGVLGPRIFNTDGSLQGSARRFPTPLTGFFGRSTLITELFPKNKISSANILSGRSDGKTPMYVDWVSGACMLIRRESLDDVGNLDERFFVYWEDADLCARMRKQGWKVVYFPLASVVHHVGGSSTKRPTHSVFEFHKSSYKLLIKHCGVFWRFLWPLAVVALAARMAFVLTWKQAENRRKRRPVNKRMRVMRIIARLNVGGPAIHTVLLHERLDPAQFESDLLYGRISCGEGDMSYLTAHLKRKPITLDTLVREIKPLKDFRSLMSTIRLLCTRQPDIVHTHTAKAGVIGRVSAIICNCLFGTDIRLVHTFHGNVFTGYFSRVRSLSYVLIERILALWTDVIVAISKSQKRELVEKYHVAPAKKVKIVSLGFDLAPFLSSGKHKGKFRHDMGIDSDTYLIGIIGRLVPIKNHRMFLEGAKLFLAGRPEIDVRFLVIGDGELRNDLEALSADLCLTEHVLFCGWQRDLPYIYADLDCVALTSLNEGTPVSIIEA
ncbi:MAG: glycosyltransferase, partial [Thermodesulfobacteriota bacterium]|nr:glycosyltransferase [Thermodesulfobacteriota bacterium]